MKYCRDFRIPQQSTRQQRLAPFDFEPDIPLIDQWDSSWWREYISSDFSFPSVENGNQNELDETLDTEKELVQQLNSNTQAVIELLEDMKETNSTLENNQIILLLLNFFLLLTQIVVAIINSPKDENK